MSYGLLLLRIRQVCSPCLDAPVLQSRINDSRWLLQPASILHGSTRVRLHASKQHFPQCRPQLSLIQFACSCADANGLQQALLAGKRGAALPAAPARLSRRARCQVRTQAALDKKKINKVVLAYSGGLDTSVILKWLQETYDCEVVTFTADLGQVGVLLTPPNLVRVCCH